MVYSLFKVTTISSRFSDSLQSQEVFYPYNATCLYTATATGQAHKGYAVRLVSDAGCSGPRRGDGAA